MHTPHTDGGPIDRKRRGRPGRGMRRRGPGGRRGPEPTLTSHDELAAWFAGSLPDDWFGEPVSVDFDRDEIIVTGRLQPADLSPDSSEDAAAVAEEARIASFREDTRAQRVVVAERAETQFRRHITWAVTCGETEALFTSANVPVMTRLRFEDRKVLDTLVGAGVARSRADALAWCVRLVGDNESDWIADIREAMQAVEQARNRGPASRGD
ncbi:MAG: hypothetical protein P8N02_01680 [Actinomycetota bacterium]|jgi:hypothetical protein|nr:hypothetical protein [Actinomycetota bacterium]